MTIIASSHFPIRLATRVLAWGEHRPQAAALLLHSGLLVALYSALYCFGVLTVLPTEISLFSWDVADLTNVSKLGYVDPTRGYNAFFPLVPLVWRYAHLSLLQASLLHATLAWCGLYILARTFAFNGRQTLFVASAPLMLFTLVPYTEGFFFLFGSLLVAGLHRHRLPLVMVGLLGCCLTRSASTLFVPAYIFAELLAWGETSTGLRLLRNLAAGLLPIAGSVGIVMLLQYYEGGDPLAFVHVHALWGHVWRWPVDLFYSSAGVTMFWLDGACLIVGMIALAACAALGLRWLRQRLCGSVQLGVSKAVLFALGYTVGAAFFIVFYQGGDLVGMSRYLMATPFWGVLLFWVWNSDWTTRWAVVAVTAVTLALGLLAGLPSRVVNFAPGEALWFFGLLEIYVACYWLVRPDRCRWFREIGAGLYMLNLFALVYLLNLFLNHIWVN